MQVWVLLVLLVAYFNGGCGACENDAACAGMFGECVCTGNHLGEYCEDSCGVFGRVSINGSACVCSGNHTGAFCELRTVMRGEDSNGEEAASGGDDDDLCSRRRFRDTPKCHTGAGWVVFGVVVGVIGFLVLCASRAWCRNPDDCQ